MRRLLVVLLFLGSFVSLAAEGRFTLRLILDGAISFAFVPTLCLVALFAVWRIGPRPAVPFAQAADTFFAGFTPWLIWLIVAGAVFGIVPPRAFAAWFYPVTLAAAVPFLWSLRIDWRFFRETLGRSPREARRDLVVSRAIAWIGGVAYFFGIALWSDVLPGLVAKLGV
ncbi:MAG TPA: hypothetical protein VJN96_13245 [Vicinamibacterales bacterium]|nr:hypothetical protein [Vicinamibacterales bacterium]